MVGSVRPHAAIGVLCARASLVEGCSSPVSECALCVRAWLFFRMEENLLLERSLEHSPSSLQLQH
jgi:hypothetical protein